MVITQKIKWKKQSKYHGRDILTRILGLRQETNDCMQADSSISLEAAEPWQWMVEGKVKNKLDETFQVIIPVWGYSSCNLNATAGRHMKDW